MRSATYERTSKQHGGLDVRANKLLFSNKYSVGGKQRLADVSNYSRTSVSEDSADLLPSLTFPSYRWFVNSESSERPPMSDVLL